MKKIMIILGLLVVLSACGNEKIEPEKENSVAETSPDVYVKFQYIDSKIENNQARITGEASASDNEFFYKVEQGERTLQAEKVVQVDADWGEFEIHVDITDEIKKAKEVVIVTMYTKQKDGSIVNPNYVPLDLEIEN